jgi:hypothetical protein
MSRGYRIISQNILNTTVGNKRFIARINSFPGEMIILTMVHHKGFHPRCPMHGSKVVIAVFVISQFSISVLMRDEPLIHHDPT